MDNNSKSRTSITIDPKLWADAKLFAARESAKPGSSKISFSELVELALKAYMEPSGG